MRRTLAFGSAFVVLSSLAFAGAAPAADAGTKGAASVHAEGSFEVKIAPQADDAGAGRQALLRALWNPAWQLSSVAERQSPCISVPAAAEPQFPVGLWGRPRSCVPPP